MSTTDLDAAIAPVSNKATAKPARRINLDPETVSAWLTEHPEFLRERQNLFLMLDAPGRDFKDDSGTVVDLQQAMIRRLQAETARQARFGRALIQAGETNLDAQTRVHRAVLELVEARGFEDFLTCLTGPVAAILDLHAVAIGVEAPEGQRPPNVLRHVAALSPGSVDRLVGAGAQVRLRTAIDRGAGMPPGPFGARAKEISSDALVRLKLGRGLPPALLALGSAKPDMFRPDQGSDLLVFLAGIVERMIGQWLDLPQN
jgi:uncharacterized protein YigA (DUF484 family)